LKYIRLKESDFSPLDDWIKKSNEILDELKKETDTQKRRVLIKKNCKHWRNKELISFLKDLSDGKCWYTEARFTAEYPQVEHFRPKSYARDENWDRVHEGYWWLAFDVDNYRLSKPMPNYRKGTYFPLKQRKRSVDEPGDALSVEKPFLIDPTEESDVDLIGYNSLGCPELVKNPIIDLNEWDKMRVNFSIERYGLNEKDLCDLRKALWISITSQFEEYMTNALKGHKQGCVKSSGKAEQIRVQLLSYLDPKNEFTKLIRNCFQAHKVGKFLLDNCTECRTAA